MTVPPIGRVAMVTARAMPDIGGIEAHVAEVARRLAARGVDVEVLATDRSGRLPAREEVDGYVVRRFRAYPRSRDWYLSPRLLVAILRGRYDLVHVQGVHTLVPPMAMLAAVLGRTPFVLTFHTGGSSSQLRAKARPLQWRLLAPLLRRAQVLVGVSVHEADQFDDVLGGQAGGQAHAGRVRVIRNGGSLPTPATPVPVDPDLVVSVGRLEHYKGHHRAVAALPHLLERRPGARLLVLGSGPYETELRRLATRLGVADRVELRHVPPVDRAAMARALAGAGAMVLLSDYEAHPVAVMEALALGRPVVVSRTSGLTELADAGWVRGVAADASPLATAEAIDAQLTHPVVPDVADLPTWDTCVDGLVEVYRAALDLPVSVSS
jgi:glycosyltransferase involved in cell wall biosynthesis